MPHARGEHDQLSYGSKQRWRGGVLPPVYARASERALHVLDKNGGTIFGDRWDVRAMPTASRMQCRLQFLGKNSFNVYPPGK